MKSIVIIFLTSFGLVAKELVFTADSADLDDAGKPGVFLDPHNHTGGILPVAAVIDPHEFIIGEELSERELTDSWFKMVKFFKNSPLFKNRGVSNGTKLILTCNKPEQYCTPIDVQEANSQGSPFATTNPECLEAVKDSLYNLFSSTPLTAFSSAYSLRGSVWQVPDLMGASSDFEQTQAKILEMAKTGASLVELSKAFIGGYKDEKSVRSFSVFKEILDDLNKANTSPKNKILKDRFLALGLNVPVVKWLLMTQTLQYGKTSEKRTLTYSNAQCLGMEMPETLNTDPQSGLYSTLVKFPDVVGVDIAGAEITCFATDGMENFKELAYTTYLASKARQQNMVKPEKMVVRIHVGEGSPLLETPFVSEQPAACEEAKKFSKIMKTNENANEYVHQKQSRINISYLLRAIEQLKKQTKDLDDYIVIRLGHMTHATKEQAELAKKLNITADVNLSSNIATQALTVDPAIIKEFLEDKGITADKVRDLYKALETNGAPIGKIFDGHGLKWLLFYDVPTVLGTDGSGVEHTTGLAHEYGIAEKLIEYWNANDKEFAERGVTINKLLGNQQRHYDAMGY